MSDRTHMVRASGTPSVASGIPCKAGNRAGATATMQAVGKGLELDTSMFSVNHLDVRCDKKKSGITLRVLVGLSALVDGVASPEGRYGGEVGNTH